MSAAHFIDESYPREALYSPSGRIMDLRESVILWQEIAAEQWHRIDGIDLGTIRVAWLTPGKRFPIRWAVLSSREREVLELLANDRAQKFIALELDLSPTKVSETARAMPVKVGVESLHGLLRSYCACGVRKCRR